MNKLTKYEEKLFNMMKSRSGVLYIVGRPGEAKTSIMESIAKKTEHQIIDIRLAQKDETDLSFPFLEDYKGFRVLNYAPPKWAVRANEKPSIIFFDELNRAPLPQRNAALEILQERRIGDFVFNDDVLFVSAGNLGEEDNTQVEEFDSALNNRLIRKKHILKFEDWRKEFADKHVWKHIVNFLEHKTEHFYKMSSDDNIPFATPRSWTFLSDYLVESFGGLDNIDTEKAILLIREDGYSFVGNSFQSLVNYLDDVLKISIQHVLSNYKGVQKEIKKIGRAKISELIESAKALEIRDFSQKELENFHAFLMDVHLDERVGYGSYFIAEVVDYRVNTFKDDHKNVYWLSQKLKEELGMLKENFQKD